MFNFFKSIFLAALATFPVFAITLPIQILIVRLFVDIQAGETISVDFTEWMSADVLLGFAAIAGFGVVFALIIGCLGAFLVDRFFMPSGGSKKQYAFAGAIVGVIGSGFFAFIFTAPAGLAGIIAGWVYGSNRILPQRASI